MRRNDLNVIVVQPVSILAVLYLCGLLFLRQVIVIAADEGAD